MVNVLLVEDDTTIARIIQYYLSPETFYNVIWVKTAGEAVGASRDHFDVILMDILLPDVSGIDLCEKLRQWHDCPIIFISCLDDSNTIVNALEKGGDDFIAKPFDNKVLAARIQANLRRAAAQSVEPIRNQLSCNGFTLDANTHIIRTKNWEYHLPLMEFRVLSYLMQNPNRYITANELYKKVWGKDSYGDVRTVMVHIHNLRKKIEPDGGSRYIKNTWGKGYLFDPAGHDVLDDKD